MVVKNYEQKYVEYFKDDSLHSWRPTFEHIPINGTITIKFYGMKEYGLYNGTGVDLLSAFKPDWTKHFIREDNTWMEPDPGIYYVSYQYIDVEEDSMMNNPFNSVQPTKILRNPKKNATTVFWSDNTKTVVKRIEGAPDDPYYAFCAALAKKVYGTNSAVNRILREKTEELKPKTKKQKVEEQDERPE